MSVRRVRCPYCGHEFTVPSTASIAVCPACGTTLWIQTGEVFREHYMYPIVYEYNRAYDAALGVAERQFAAPEDLREGARPKGGMIHYVPLHLYHVRVVASCPQNPEAGLEEAYVSRLATRNPPRGLGLEYKFPTRGRRFFEPRTLRRGRYYQPDVKPEELLDEVSSRATLKALREAYNWCDEPKVENKTRWLGLVHYPFWEVTYAYGTREYYALVDAVDGTVVYLEYPIGHKKRAALLGGAAALFIGSMLIGMGLGHALDALGAGAAGGAISSLPGVYSFLRLGTARIGRYVLGGRVGLE